MGDLLRLRLRTWEDRSRYNTLSEWNKCHKLNVPVTVIDYQWFGYGRMKALKLIIPDSKGARTVLIFERYLLLIFRGSSDPDAFFAREFVVLFQILDECFTGVRYSFDVNFI